MAHPHLFLGTNLPDAVKDCAGLCHTHHRAAELAVIGCLHPPAELLDHGLLAITNAKYRYAQVEDLVRRPRRIYVENRRRPAGQYDRPRIEIGKRFPGDLIEWMNFAINATFTNSARDQLGNLRTEIDNEDVVGRGHGSATSPEGELCSIVPDVTDFLDICCADFARPSGDQRPANGLEEIPRRITNKTPHDDRWPPHFPDCCHGACKKLPARADAMKFITKINGVNLCPIGQRRVARGPGTAKTGHVALACFRNIHQMIVAKPATRAPPPGFLLV